MLTPPSGGKAEQVNDSAVIAERLLDAIDSAKLTNVRKAKDFRSAKAMEWATWSDSKLAVLLFPNITRSYAEAFEAFKYVQAVPHFSFVDKISNQLVGSLAMWLVSGTSPVLSYRSKRACRARG
jgi:microsomal prostaglandin-E synthase 2